MHKQMKQLTGQKTCFSAGCLKSKDGMLILEKEKILQHWNKYIGELFHNERKQPEYTYGPEILKTEVEAALAKLNRNKAAGPDGIVTKMLTALDDFSIDKITEIISDIYNSGYIEEDLSRSIFIAMPKKQSANECELHRTISSMSHVTKLIIRILMNRVCSRIRPDIRHEQCGFVKDTRTRNRISERAIQMQKYVHLCFIDYAKALDNVRHKDLLELHSNLDIFKKDIRIIKNLYWQQTACMHKEKEFSKYTKI